MLYIQKSVSENAGIAVIGVEKCKNFPGENTSRPPTNKRDITPNFLLPTTIYHFSTLGIVWSLFVDGPPTDEFLKNALLPLAQDIPYFNLYFTLSLAPGVGSSKAGLTLTRS